MQANEERDFINKFFEGKVGRFLEIGAFDGVTDSLTRDLIDRGWSGVQIEPNPHAFVKLKQVTNRNPKITLVNAAVGLKSELVRFWNVDDISDLRGQISTLSPHVAEGFRTSSHEVYMGVVYDVHYVQTVSIETLLKEFGLSWDLIVVDAEGMDVDILTAMPLTDMVDCTLICAEDFSKIGRILPECYKPCLITDVNVIASRIKE